MEKAEEFFVYFTQTQKNIYRAVYSRSCDGFVREKHIRALPDNKLAKWIYSIILKLSDENVVEMVELLYHELRLKNTDA